ncbi:MAG: hypothetical protein KDK97_04045 [Verrucomicrobiales bacterium]|nr:hypothetical protein [Verrucomicrobiales bacterium]MCP5557185.1 hypothetical protein [Verrucomicrobiaceae bacterium]
MCIGPREYRLTIEPESAPINPSPWLTSEKEQVLKLRSYDTFGCPGITYDLGYSTDRALIKTVSTGAAEEMMRLLLEAAKP